MSKVYELEVKYLKKPIPVYAKLAYAELEFWAPRLTSEVWEAISAARNVIEDVKYKERNQLMSLEDRTTGVEGNATDGYYFYVVSANRARKVLEVRYKPHIK